MLPFVSDLNHHLIKACFQIWVTHLFCRGDECAAEWEEETSAGHTGRICKHLPAVTASFHPPSQSGGREVNSDPSPTRAVPPPSQKASRLTSCWWEDCSWFHFSQHIGGQITVGLRLTKGKLMRVSVLSSLFIPLAAQSSFLAQFQWWWGPEAAQKHSLRHKT